jgi:hypothetical protein
MAKKKPKKKQRTEAEQKQHEYDLGSKDARLFKWLGFSKVFLREVTLHNGLSRKVRHSSLHNYTEGFNDTLFPKEDD